MLKTSYGDIITDQKPFVNLFNYYFLKTDDYFGEIRKGLPSQKNPLA